MGTEVEVLLKALLAGAMVVLGYFLRETAGSLKEVRTLANDLHVRVSVLESKTEGA